MNPIATLTASIGALESAFQVCTASRSGSCFTACRRLATLSRGEAVPPVLRQHDRLPLVAEAWDVGEHDQGGDPDGRPAPAMARGGCVDAHPVRGHHPVPGHDSGCVIGLGLPGQVVERRVGGHPGLQHRDVIEELLRCGADPRHQLVAGRRANGLRQHRVVPARSTPARTSRRSVSATTHRAPAARRNRSPGPPMAHSNRNRVRPCALSSGVSVARTSWPMPGRGDRGGRRSPSGRRRGCRSAAGRRHTRRQLGAVVEGAHRLLRTGQGHS